MSNLGIFSISLTVGIQVYIKVLNLYINHNLKKVLNPTQNWSCSESATLTLLKVIPGKNFRKRSEYGGSTTNNLHRDHPPAGARFESASAEIKN